MQHQAWQPCRLKAAGLAPLLRRPCARTGEGSPLASSVSCLASDVLRCTLVSPSSLHSALRPRPVSRPTPHAEFAYKVQYRCRSGQHKHFRVVSWATTNRQGKVLRGKADIKLLPKARW